MAYTLSGATAYSGGNVQVASSTEYCGTPMFTDIICSADRTWPHGFLDCRLSPSLLVDLIMKFDIERRFQICFNEQAL